MIKTFKMEAVPRHGRGVRAAAQRAVARDDRHDPRPRRPQLHHRAGPWTRWTLFGYIEIDDPERRAAGADTAINRKWWDFMADIMETNEDNSPVSMDLPVLFHLD